MAAIHAYGMDVFFARGAVLTASSGNVSVNVEGVTTGNLVYVQEAQRRGLTRWPWHRAALAAPLAPLAPVITIRLQPSFELSSPALKWDWITSATS